MLCLNYFCVALVVCFDLLFCWKTNLLPNHSCLAHCIRWSSGISLYVAALIFPSTSNRLPWLDTTTTMLHCVDGVFVMTCTVWCPLNIVSSLMAKQLNLGLNRSRTFFQLTLESPACLLFNFSGDLIWDFLKSGFLFASVVSAINRTVLI